MSRWRVDGRGGRYVVGSGGTWRADRVTAADLREAVGQPVRMTPTGPLYEPTGPADPVGLYLWAVSLVPGPLVISGVVPNVPPAPFHPDVVY